jgi:phage tail sheath protein FI|tara:strand:+ start:26702 stop:28942 length:2241 start_codon:yes stop_codon:yes gene_type:complete
MVNFVSPGVYVIEKDISDYTPSINPTVVGIVGFATKGPGNKPTLITSAENLKKTFGEPQETLAGQGLEGALEILKDCNQVYYVRAVDTATSADASTVVRMGSAPAIGVSAGAFGVTSSIYLKVKITDNNGTVPSEFLTPRSYSVPAGLTVGGAAATSQAAAMKSVLGGDLQADKVGSYFNEHDTDLTGRTVGMLGNFIVGNYAGSGATLSVSAYSSSDYDAAKGTRVLLALDGSGNPSACTAAGLPNADRTDDLPYRHALVSSLTVKGFTFVDASATSGLGYKVESLHPGTGYNTSTNADGATLGIQAQVTPLGNRDAIFNVLSQGAQEENRVVSLVGSGAYIEDQVNTGDTESVNGFKSQFIKGNLFADNAIFSDNKLTYYQSYTSSLGAGKFIHMVGGAPSAAINETLNYQSFLGTGVNASAASPRFVKLIEGTRNMFNGANGDGNGNTTQEATALIGVTAPKRTGIQALDDELAPVTIACVPGITDQDVQNGLVSLAESKGNFLAVLGTPIGIGQPQDAIQFANGTSPYRSAALNSSYAALYYPAVKKLQVEFGKDMWFDPAIFGVKVMAKTDTIADVWFAPAGLQRGKLSVTDVEVDLNQGDRDSLYGNGNCINPITNFGADGVVIFGQRTTQRQPTALDRINVRRLMIYIKRLVEASTKRFIFEPNDPLTQERITNLLTPAFADIQQRRGITSFRVICDETVNTPERVDRNELWCKVLIKPTKAAEMLVFELNVTNQATSF